MSSTAKSHKHISKCVFENETKDKSNIYIYQNVSSKMRSAKTFIFLSGYVLNHVNFEKNMTSKTTEC